MGTPYKTRNSQIITLRLRSHIPKNTLKILEFSELHLEIISTVLEKLESFYQVGWLFRVAKDSYFTCKKGILPKLLS
jgi:hypothetical protein